MSVTCTNILGAITTMANPIYLQLYTLRDDAAVNLHATLDAVAEAGYAGVELAGLYDLTPAALKAELDARSLTVIGAHSGYADLLADVPAAIELCRVFETSRLTVPWIEGDWRDSIENMRALGASLAAAGAQLRDAGIQLCYHNHAFEFEMEDASGTGYAAVLSGGDGYIAAELDLYWVAKAGKDPIAELQRLNGHVPLVHIKDMSEDGDFRPVGDGIIDYKGSVLQAAIDAGAQGFIVEQDQCSTYTPLESIARSITALRNWGFAS